MRQLQPLFATTAATTTMTRLRFSSSLRRSVAGVVCAFGFAGCAVGTAYTVPDAPVPARYKEPASTEPTEPAAPGGVAASNPLWQPAMPADAADRGAWWMIFGDKELDRLAERVQISNQNIAAAVANYAQAQALVRQQRASLFPSVIAGLGASRSGGGNAANSTARVGSSLGADIGVNWAPDVWGRLRNSVDGASAGAQASQADLASARLSAVGELAINYFSLREADAEIILLDATVDGYLRALDITRNRYAAGIVAQSDILQAETQWVNARADRVNLQRNRAQFEHAIAVLVGTAPGDFSVPAAVVWRTGVVAVPAGVPSSLLQRRSDISAAERSVAAAHAQIGIAQSAYYPSLNLSGSVGGSGSRLGDLFRASNHVWSLGMSVAQVIFDGGAIAAQVDSATAVRDASVARYRQTVLAAFQSVEDQLAAGSALAQQNMLRQQASAAADKAEAQMLNRYRAGQVNYTDVVAAQATALTARRALVQLQLNRQVAAVLLVQALGGGWQAQWMSAAEPAVVQTTGQ